MALRESARRSSAAIVAAVFLAATVSGSVTASPHATSRAHGSPTSAAVKNGFAKDFSHHRGTAGIRPSINVAQLAKSKPPARPKAHLPKLTHTPTSSGSSDTKPRLAAAAPPPVPATTNTDGSAALTGFDGLAESTSAFTNREPPDPWVAVGPEHIVQAVNLQLRMTNRLGTSPIDVDLPAFFQLPVNPVTFDSDPHVIYDSLHGRWIATEVSWDCDTSDPVVNFGHGYIDVAVSDNADPTGNWSFQVHHLRRRLAGLPGTRNVD